MIRVELVGSTGVTLQEAVLGDKEPRLTLTDLPVGIREVRLISVPPPPPDPLAQPLHLRGEWDGEPIHITIERDDIEDPPADWGDIAARGST